MREKYSKTLLPDAIAMGVHEWEFWSMTMRGFNALAEGYKRNLIVKDKFNWMLGLYIQSAVAVAIEHNFAGNDARTKYIEKPFMQNEGIDEMAELTEEEKKKQTEQFFLKLRVMESNFNLSKDN